LQQIGARIYFRRARSSPLPLPPPEMKTLASGAVLDYAEDLSVWALEPVPPGEYQVTAVYVHGGRVYRSAPRALRVVLPRFEKTAATAGLSRARLGEVVLQAIGGRFAIAQREAEEPGTGTWLERVRPSVAVDGLAIATEVDEDSRDRWIAWLEGGAFRAGIWQNRNQIRVTDPLPLGLQSPLLVACGWQYADARALFVAAGYSGGRAVAKFISVAVEGPPQVHEADLAGSLPRRLDATFVREGARDAVYLCWTEEQPGGAKIYARKYVPGKPVRNPALLIAQAQAPPVAVAIEPVSSDSPPLLRAVFGPGPQRKMIYSFIPLAKGGKRRDQEFTAPAAREAPGPWSIAAGPGRNHLVVVQVGGRLMFTRTGGSGAWHVLVENVPPSSAAGLFAVRDPWAVWNDPAVGLCYRRVPPLP
jgi:hypothetical protein